MIEVLLAVSLFHKVLAAEEQQNAQRIRYQCRELQENWDDGQKEASLRSKLYEVVLLEGVRYRKLVERNGHPIDAEERRLVNEDMLRTSVLRQAVTERPAGERLATLERTHDLSMAAPNEIVAIPKTTGRSYRIFFDPVSFVILSYVREDDSMKLTVEYAQDLKFARDPAQDSPHFLRRLEVRFTAGLPRIQQSSFTEYRLAQ